MFFSWNIFSTNLAKRWPLQTKLIPLPAWGRGMAGDSIITKPWPALAELHVSVLLTTAYTSTNPWKCNWHHLTQAQAQPKLAQIPKMLLTTAYTSTNPWKCYWHQPKQALIPSSNPWKCYWQNVQSHAIDNSLHKPRSRQMPQTTVYADRAKHNCHQQQNIQTELQTVATDNSWHKQSSRQLPLTMV